MVLYTLLKVKRFVISNQLTALLKVLNCQYRKKQKRQPI